MELQNKYIVIEGNIGAGKTSLVNKIAEQFNGKQILEQFHDNPGPSAILSNRGLEIMSLQYVDKNCMGKRYISLLESFRQFYL